LGYRLYSFAENTATMNEQLLATVENSRNYTLQVAEAMPDNAYTFKPSGAGWNFGELLHHIAYGIQWWEDNYIKGNKTDWNPPAAITNKQQVVNYLNKAYDSLKDTVKKQSLTEEAVKGVHATLDHITHHRGQTVIYLRTKGITPPEYTY
jgi:uncharacterized damage-inducible protein DinB